ncbi:MAG: DNA replication/repair protein RecF [Microbacterium ginsengisoli]|uniref:DNA replication/repair protein RecF n=2 Tax=Microbacteriaceae TaxID=85023 RepID=UPI0006F3A52B|nr:MULTISPECIES: DNA replication/repair protein RecF [unclassified Microbacterium]KQR92080.1 recombinase RecF [Microbacterium sp. Leaf347]MBN9197688.1 DNA replication/repair protein RecF [Microbacterium ginsengisoli]OJU79389.1 MAG: DNA replication/repair protein RecF [Microbacterium sp. 71-23]
MFVEQLSLVDFRNYAHADLALERGPNLFVGRNGQGKTNLAEAIAYLATLGSHRVALDAPLVRRGQDAAIVRARIGHGERRLVVELQINRQGGNKARVGGSPVRPGELPRYAHVVLFAPEDLQIVRGDPSARRRFADQLLVQRHPRMSAVLGDYDRVLRQRNTLLKSARARGVQGSGLATLEVWDDKLIELGAQIIDARQGLAVDIAGPLASAYASIAGADHDPSVRWVRSIDGGDPEEDESASEVAAASDTATAFRQALTARRSIELDRGLTLVGPHRDDLLVSVRGLPVKGYASHGESWSAALSLRLASAALLREERSTGDPVLILDDVFAELDADRRTRLAGVIHDFEQVIVTAAVEADVPAALRGRTVRIDSGQIVGVSDG